MCQSFFLVSDAYVNTAAFGSLDWTDYVLRALRPYDLPPPYEHPPSYFEAVNGFVEDESASDNTELPVAEDTPDGPASISLTSLAKKYSHDFVVFLIFISTILVLWGVNDKKPEEKITALQTVALNSMGIMLIYISFQLPKKITTNVKYILVRGLETADLLISVFLIFASFVMFKEFMSSAKDKRLVVAAFCHVLTFIIELGIVLGLLITFKCTRATDHENGRQSTFNTCERCFVI